MDLNTINNFDLLYNLFNEQKVIEDNNTINKEKFVELLPEYLNKPGTVKSDHINKLPGVVSEADLPWLLFKQDAIDFASYYYLNKKHC
jgi:hypothetical protein